MISAGVFAQLKQSKDPSVIKELNKYIKFRTKLAEAKMRLDFLNDCITKSEFPKYFWKILRRNHIKPTFSTLKRHTRNEQETVTGLRNDLERNLSLCLCVLETLSNNERSTFLDYVELIITECVDTIRKKLTKQLNTISLAPTKFPSNPERYVHNLSSLCLDKTLLEVLSLGPKFVVLALMLHNSI